MILPSATALRVAVLCALAALGGAVVPALGWIALGCTLMVAGLVIVDGLGLPRAALATRRRVPGRLSLRVAERVVTEVESLVDTPLCVRLCDAEPSSIDLAPATSATVRLPPRGTVEFVTEITGRQRGEHHLERAMVRWGRPGGWAVRQHPLVAATPLRVFPNLARLRRYDALRRARALANMGLRTTPRVGQAAEFDHLRSYQRGDDPRRMHWKATARRGFPVVQAVRAEHGRHLVLAVDVSHWMGLSAGAMTRLDWTVDAALFLVHVALEAGDRVGLVLFADEVRAFLPPSSRPGQQRRAIEMLYDVRAEPAHPSYAALVRHLLARRLPRSLVVVLSEPPDEEADAELGRAMSVLRSRHRPLVVSLRDPALRAMARAVPAGLPDLYRRLAAAETLDEGGQRLRRLRQRGLEVLEADPEALPVAMADRYLDLKAVGA